MALFSLERLFLGLKEGSFHYKFGHIERFQFDFIFSYKEDILLMQIITIHKIHP